jgi:glycerol-1-phosphate dehydrogenase [NAD(P)+]
MTHTPKKMGRIGSDCEHALAVEPYIPIHYEQVTSDEHDFAALAVELQARDQRQVLVVADENTYPACGQQVNAALAAAGLEVALVILSGQPWVAADESSIAEVLRALNGRRLALVAVGSGTITDITRFVAFQTRLPFYSVPTAPSVDAYTSYTAAITIREVKYSFPTKTASGVYASLPVLCAAPRRMIASGFGDMVAKYTALADWKLAHLLMDEALDETAAREAEAALQSCIRQAAAVRTAESAGIAALIDSLFVSGCCMVRVRSSRPAAGAEHSLAHFWEIQHQLNHRPESLHGEKTGVASVIIAGLYEKLRQMTRQEAQHRLDRVRWNGSEPEMARIKAAYGGVAGQVIANQASFLGPFGQKIDLFRERLLSRWDDVQAIAAQVPGVDQIRALLQSAGATWQPEQIHVSEAEVRQAIQSAMYIRDRLTILEINYILDL